MSRDEFCLENYGKTYEEVMQANVQSLSRALAMCQELGVDINAVIPGQAGSTPMQVQSTDNTNEEENERN